MLSAESFLLLFAEQGELEGLQGCCLVAFFAYQLTLELLPGGFLAIDIFFVLSGFTLVSQLLCRVLVRSKLSAIKENKGSQAFSHFGHLSKTLINRAFSLVVNLFPFFCVACVYLFFLRQHVIFQAAGLVPIDPLSPDAVPSIWLDELHADARSALLFVQNWQFVTDNSKALQFHGSFTQIDFTSSENYSLPRDAGLTLNALFKQLWPFSIDLQCCLLISLVFLFYLKATSLSSFSSFSSTSTSSLSSSSSAAAASPPPPSALTVAFSSLPAKPSCAPSIGAALEDFEADNPHQPTTIDSNNAVGDIPYKAQLLVLFTALAALSTLRMVSTPPNNAYQAVWATDSRLHQFAMGCIAAVLTFHLNLPRAGSRPHTSRDAQRNRRFHLLLNVASHFSALCLLGCFIAMRENSLFYFRGGSLLVALLTMLILIGLSVPTAGQYPLNWFLSNRPLRWLGRLALPAYVWHWAFAIILPAPPAVTPVAAIVVAAVQQVAVGRLLRLKTRAYNSLFKLVAAALIVYLCIVFVSFVAASPPVPPALSFSPQTERRGLQTKIVAIVGDDLARSIVPGMLQAAQLLNSKSEEVSLRLKIVDCTFPGKSAAGFLHGRRPLRRSGAPASQQQAHDLLEQLAKLVDAKPDVIWMLSTYDYLQPRLERDGAVLLAGDPRLQAADDLLYYDWETTVLEEGGRTHLYYATVPQFVRAEARDQNAFLKGRAEASNSIFLQHLDEIVCPHHHCPTDLAGFKPFRFGSIIGSQGQSEWLAARILDEIAVQEQWNFSWTATP